MEFFNQVRGQGRCSTGWNVAGRAPFERADLHRGHRDPGEVRPTVRVPGQVGHRPAVRARALPDRGDLQVPGDPSPTTRKEIKAFYMRLNDDGKTVRRDGRARARHRRDHRRQPARGAARRARAAASRSTAWTRRTTGGIWTCGATAPCRTRASAWASSGSLMFLTGMENIRDVIPFARTPGTRSSDRDLGLPRLGAPERSPPGRRSRRRSANSRPPPTLAAGSGGARRRESGLHALSCPHGC